MLDHYFDEWAHDHNCAYCGRPRNEHTVKPADKKGGLDVYDVVSIGLFVVSAACFALGLWLQLK